jgi:hypothetical protein
MLDAGSYRMFAAGQTSGTRIYPVYLITPVSLIWIYGLSSFCARQMRIPVISQRYSLRKSRQMDPAASAYVYLP